MWLQLKTRENGNLKITSLSNLVTKLFSPAYRHRRNNSLEATFALQIEKQYSNAI